MSSDSINATRIVTKIIGINAQAGAAEIHYRLVLSRWRMFSVTHQTLRRIINRVNRKPPSGSVFVSGGTAPVRFGHAWLSTRVDGELHRHQRDFWFVFEQGNCVAAIYDMYDDLHVYTLKSHRRKGLMLNALKSIVLPALARAGRDEQRVQYQSMRARALLTKLDAKILDDTHASIDLRPYKDSELVPTERGRITPDRRKAMRYRLRLAVDALDMVRDECRITTGRTDDLAAILEDARYSADQARDLLADFDTED